LKPYGREKAPQLDEVAGLLPGFHQPIAAKNVIEVVDHNSVALYFKQS
jgi:hypothetical protein